MHRIKLKSKKYVKALNLIANTAYIHHHHQRFVMLALNVLTIQHIPLM